MILPDRAVDDGEVRVEGDRIAVVGPAAACGTDASVIDVGDGYIVPGFVDLHVHGGGGADFMDGTNAAFETALACHARHDTTSLAVTTTYLRRLEGQEDERWEKVAAAIGF